MSNESQTLATEVKSISVGLIARHMVYAINAKRPAFFWSSPGVGKSQIVREVARCLGFHLEDLRLSQVEAVDLRGLPVKSYTEFKLDDNNNIIDEEARNQHAQKTGSVTVEWAMPDFLVRARKAKEQGLNTLFFFDELNHADDTNQSAAYQFILEGQIGCFTIDEGDCVFAAGNFENEGSIANPMSLALANRLIHYYVEHDVESWLSWGQKSGIHPILLAYVDRNRDQFVDDFAQIEEDDGATKNKAFKTPRTLEYASDMIYSILEQGQEAHNMLYGNASQNIDDSLKNDEKYQAIMKELFPPLSDDDIEYDLSVALAGCVGTANSDNIMTFIRAGKDVPDPRDILTGKVKSYEDTTASKNRIDIQAITSNQCLGILINNYEKLKKLHLEKTGKSIIPAIPSKDPELKSAVDEFYSSYENFVLFAKNNFNKDMFIYSIITKLIRSLQIQPIPTLLPNMETFNMIHTELLGSTRNSFND